MSTYIINLTIYLTIFILLIITACLFMQKVNTTNDKIRKKYDKINFLSSMHSSMSSLYDGDSKKNTTLMELTVRQHKRFKDNIIHLWNVRNCAECKHIYIMITFILGRNYLQSQMKRYMVATKETDTLICKK